MAERIKRFFVQVFVRYSAIDSDLSRGWRTHQSKIEWKIIKPSENPFRVYLFYPFHFIYNPWRLHLWSFVAILRFSMFQKLISDLFRSQNSNSDSDTHCDKYKCFRNSKVQKRIRTVRVGHEPSHGFRLGHWYVRKPDPNSVKLNPCLPTYVRVRVH